MIVGQKDANNGFTRERIAEVKDLLEFRGKKSGIDNEDRILAHNYSNI